MKKYSIMIIMLIAVLVFSVQVNGETDEVKLKDADKELKILNVGDFSNFKTIKEGTVTLVGKVKESYPRRGVFILVDVKQMEECASKCCPQITVPVRHKKIEGKYYPAVNDHINLTAVYKKTETGYSLDVKEIKKK